MNDYICREYIQKQAFIIRCQEILKDCPNGMLIFGNREDVGFLRDKIAELEKMPYCEKCECRFDCKKYLERKEKNNETI